MGVLVRMIRWGCIREDDQAGVLVRIIRRVCW